MDESLLDILEWIETLSYILLHPSMENGAIIGTAAGLRLINDKARKALELIRGKDA